MVNENWGSHKNSMNIYIMCNGGMRWIFAKFAKSLILGY